MAKKIKVSEKTVQELRKGTMAGNLAKAKNASPEMKEALIRFYGTKRVAQAGGITDSKRAKLGTLPKKSVDIKLKTVAQAKPKAPAGGRNSGPVVQTRRSAAPTTKAPNREAANKGVSAKSVGKKLDSVARNVYKYAGPENFIAGGAAIKAGKVVGKVASKTAKSASVAKNTRTLKTATGSKANLARTKVGYAKGMATKSEVQQAKAAVSKKRGK